MLSIQTKLKKRAAIILIVIIVLGFILNSFITHKVESILKTSLPNNITLNYDNLNVSTLGRSLSMDNVFMRLKDSTSQQELANFSIERLDFKHFGLMDFIANKTISLGSMGIKNAKGYLKLSDSPSQDTTALAKNLPFGKISVGKINLRSISLELKDQKTDSFIGSISDLNFKLSGLEAIVLEDNYMLSYDEYAIASDSINFVLGPFNNLKIKSVNGTQDSTNIAFAELKTKYEPSELRNHITHEMDYYDLTIERISIQDIPKILTMEATSLKIGKVILDNPDAFIYRDKLLADDLSIKPMFSEMIRSIPTEFTIGNFEINKANLTYKERVHAFNEGGSLSVENGSITIANLSNTAAHQPVSIDVDAMLGGSAIVKANWQFDVLDENDAFNFSADVSHINLKAINTFSQPNFNTKMEGHIDKLYYNISGNKYASHIHIKSKHSDIKIAILDKTHKSRNKFFSSVANLIIDKNSNNTTSGFSEAKADVERDRTKSSINFIFRNIKSGLTKIFI